VQNAIYHSVKSTLNIITKMGIVATTKLVTVGHYVLIAMIQKVENKSHQEQGNIEKKKIVILDLVILNGKIMQITN